MPQTNKTVYSTDPAAAKRCPQCGRYPCRCPQPQALPPKEQTARVQRERKGRGGKTVTLVRDLQLAPADLAALAKQLKAVCGTGGTVKDGVIEIQGDQRDRVAEELKRLGYRAKIAGG